MRKTYPLQIEGRNRDRVLDAVRHDIRKYLQRERRRPVPEGAQFWDFDCRFGLAPDSAEVVPLVEIKPRLDAAARDGAEKVYVEIIARAAVRAPRPAGNDAATADAATPQAAHGDAPG